MINAPFFVRQPLCRIVKFPEIGNGILGKEELTSPVALQNLHNLNFGVGYCPARYALVLNLHIAWNFVVGRQLDAVEDLFQQRHTGNDGVDPLELGQLAEVERLTRAQEGPDGFVGKVVRTPRTEAIVEIADERPKGVARA